MADFLHDVTSQSFTNINILNILKLLYAELLSVSLNLLNQNRMMILIQWHL